MVDQNSVNVDGNSENTFERELRTHAEWTPFYRVQRTGIAFLLAIVNLVRTLDLSPIRNVTPDTEREKDD